jgi:HSP20 family protein
MFEQFEEMFEDGPLGEMRMDFSPSGSMSVDVYDEGEEILVTADIPGFDSDTISVSLDQTGRLLTISAEDRAETTEEGEEGEYVWRERRSSAFNRTVKLPTQVELSENLNGKYTNGVLTVRLPKQTEDHTVTIDIEDATDE